MFERRIRVLHVVGSMNPGGIETWLLNVLKFANDDRFAFDICTFGREPGIYAKEVKRLGGRMISCPRNESLWLFPRRFRRILCDGQYDIVHSHVTLFSGAVLRWAYAEGVPVRIAHSHNSHDGQSSTLVRRSYRRAMSRWINRYATHGVAASGLAATALFGADWRSDTRLAILHCGIDLHPFQCPVDPGLIRQEVGIPADARVVGHVGRFDTQKNHHFLLEIARVVLGKNADIHFLLVGNGSLQHRVEDRCKELGLASRVHFAGIRGDVPRLMKGAMDVFVLPSLWEGLPLVLLEAQAAGLPCVVSSEITEEAELLPKGYVRISVSEDAKTWADKIIEVLAQGRFHGNETQDIITQTDFHIERSVSRLSSLYLGAVGS